MLPKNILIKSIRSRSIYRMASLLFIHGFEKKAQRPRSYFLNKIPPYYEIWIRLRIIRIFNVADEFKLTYTNNLQVYFIMVRFYAGSHWDR